MYWFYPVMPSRIIQTMGKGKANTIHIVQWVHGLAFIRGGASGQAGQAMAWPLFNTVYACAEHTSVSAKCRLCPQCLVMASVNLKLVDLSTESLDENLPDVGDKPHQPLSFSFPKREFGKTIIVKRSFQSQWFIKWQWLHYDQSRDLAFCHMCVMAVK